MKQISLMNQPSCDHIISVLLIKKSNVWPEWGEIVFVKFKHFFNCNVCGVSGETSQLCTTMSVQRICMSLCVKMFVSVEPDCNIRRAFAWACETEGGQPDGWVRETEAEGRFVKHNTGRRNRERGIDEWMSLKGATTLVFFKPQNCHWGGHTWKKKNSFKMRTVTQSEWLNFDSAQNFN